MQAISALAFIPFGSYRRTNLCLQKFWRPTVPKLCNYLTWVVHACRHINELCACQVSDGYLVKQASSSGSNFSRFWQLMEEKFGPKVTSIFRAETSAKRYTWDKQSIRHMHLRFSFFCIWAIAIRSRENHVFPQICPRKTQQRKKENFWDFFPMNISEISISSAQFQADSWKSLLHINLHWLPIQNTNTLYNFALKQSSALILAPSIYLSK